jgi:hypothetical protein
VVAAKSGQKLSPHAAFKLKVFVRVLLYEKVDLRVSLNFLKAYCVVIKDKA